MKIVSSRKFVSCCQKIVSEFMKRPREDGSQRDPSELMLAYRAELGLSFALMQAWQDPSIHQYNRDQLDRVMRGDDSVTNDFGFDFPIPSIHKFLDVKASLISAPHILSGWSHKGISYVDVIYTIARRVNQQDDPFVNQDIELEYLGYCARSDLLPAQGKFGSAAFYCPDGCSRCTSQCLKPMTDLFP